MTEWKLPPMAKAYEALGAVADGRVRVVGPAEAQVTSSDGDRVYTVSWTEDHRELTSNDNASYWQGYAGYPVIAVLLATGVIDYDPEIAQALAGVPWKRLNDRHKRDYDAAVEEVLRDIAARGGDRAAVAAQAEAVHRRLAALKPERGPRKRPPPKRTTEGSDDDRS